MNEYRVHKSNRGKLLNLKLQENPKMNMSIQKFKHMFNYPNLQISKQTKALCHKDLKLRSASLYIKNLYENRKLNNYLSQSNNEDFKLKIQQKLDRYLKVWCVSIDENLWKKTRIKGYSCEFIKSFKNNKLLKSYYIEIFQNILCSTLDDRDKLLLKFLIKYQGTPVGLQIHLNKPLQKHLQSCAASLNLSRIPRSYLKNIIRYWPIAVHQIIRNEQLMVYTFHEPPREITLDFDDFHFSPGYIIFFQLDQVIMINDGTFIVTKELNELHIAIICNQGSSLRTCIYSTISHTDIQRKSNDNCFQVIMKHLQKYLKHYCLIMKPESYYSVAISSFFNSFQFHIHTVRPCVCTPIVRVISTYNQKKIIESHKNRWVESYFYKEDNIFSQLVKINIQFHYLNR